MRVKLTGIEITEESMSAVTVERQPGSMRVTACARVYRDEGPADEGALLVALGRSLGDVGEKVAVVLPAGEMVVRRARLPFRDAKVIDKTLSFELEPTLPMPLEGLRIAWDKRPVGEKDSEVLAFLIPDEALDDRRVRFKAAGMVPMVLAPTAVATALTLARSEGPFFLTLQRVGGHCTLTVVSEGAVMFLRSFALPAEGYVEILTREVWQTLVALAEREGMWRVPEKIWASGWVKLPETLVTPLGELPVEATRILSTTGAVLDEGMKTDWEEGPYDGALSVACSALSGWKHPVLWRQGFAWTEFAGKHKGPVLFTAALVALLIILLTTRAAVGIRQTGSQLAAVERQMASLYLETFPGERRAPSPMVLLPSMEGKVRVAREEAVYAGQGAARVRIIDILKSISTMLPKELKVNLTRLTLSKGKLTVSGLAEDFSAIDTMKGAMEKSPLFAGVTIASSSKESGGDRFQFKMVIALSGRETL